MELPVDVALSSNRYSFDYRVAIINAVPSCLNFISFDFVVLSFLDVYSEYLSKSHSLVKIAVNEHRAHGLLLVNTLWEYDEDRFA